VTLIRHQQRAANAPRLTGSRHENSLGLHRHGQVFANVEAAEKWFEENDPEGVAFAYEVEG
jgi:hypothetical protein